MAGLAEQVFPRRRYFKQVFVFKFVSRNQFQVDVGET